MYLLRIHLPDAPGSLGEVATALGTAGADIIALDVVERQADGTAIDDVLVELPLGGRADSLVSACHSIPGVQVSWLSRYNSGGDLHRDLEAVEAMTADPKRGTSILVTHAPGVFRADWALLVTPTHPGYQVRHATSGAPGLPDSSPEWMPLSAPARLIVPDSWSDPGWRDFTLAAVPVGDPDTAVVIGRRGGPEILDSELARLAHLASLANAITGYT